MTVLDFIRFFRLEKKAFTPRTQLTVPSDLLSMVREATEPTDKVDFFCNGSRSVCMVLVNDGSTWIAKRGSRLVLGHLRNQHPELAVARDGEDSLDPIQRQAALPTPEIPALP